MERSWCLKINGNTNVYYQLLGIKLIQAAGQLKIASLHNHNLDNSYLLV